MAIGAVTAFIVGVELKNPWAALLVAMLSGALWLQCTVSLRLG